MAIGKRLIRASGHCFTLRNRKGIQVSSGPRRFDAVTPSNGADGDNKDTASSAVRSGPSAGTGLLAKAACGVDFEHPEQSRRVGRIEGSVLGALLEVFSQDLDPKEAITRALQALGDTVGCEVVARWAVDPVQDVLRLEELWHSPATPAGQLPAGRLETTMAPGVGLAGRVWKSGRPAWIEEVGADSEFLGAEAFVDGLHSALAFPVVAQGRLLGVIELFSSDIRHPEPDLLASMATVGERLGAFLERLEAEDERGRLLVAERAARIRAERAQAAAERIEKRLAVLAEAGKVLVTSLDSRRTLQDLTELGLGVLGELCVVALVDDSGRLRLVAGSHTDPVKRSLLALLLDLPLAPCSTIADVVGSGSSRVLGVVGDETFRSVFEVLEHRALVRALGLGPLMIVPLTVRRQTIGVLIFSASSGTQPYGPADVALADELARRAAAAIDNAGTFARTSEVAHVLQQSLLPPRLPDIPGIEIAARYHPAGEHLEVGGDFYDVFSVNPESWGFLIGDVVGKGPAAAAMTALVRHTARTAARHGPPWGVPTAVNDALLEAGPEEAFCTMIYGQLCTTAAGPSLCLLNCGHPAALVLRAKGPIEEVASCGPLLGQFPEVTVEPAVLTLRPRDVVVLVTDGVLEARTPRSPTGATRWFGSEGLRLAMAETRGAPAATIASRIQERAVAFSGGSLKDDLAILVLRVLSPKRRDESRGDAPSQ